jgi:hypothetical protein
MLSQEECLLFVCAALMADKSICLRLFWHWDFNAAEHTFCTAGSSSQIRMAIMAITTNNSTRVKPRLRVTRMRNMTDFLWMEKTTPIT